MVVIIEKYATANSKTKSNLPVKITKLKTSSRNYNTVRRQYWTVQNVILVVSIPTSDCEFRPGPLRLLLIHFDRRPRRR